MPRNHLAISLCDYIASGFRIRRPSITRYIRHRRQLQLAVLISLEGFILNLHTLCVGNHKREDRKVVFVCGRGKKDTNTLPGCCFSFQHPMVSAYNVPNRTWCYMIRSLNCLYSRLPFVDASGRMNALKNNNTPKKTAIEWEYIYDPRVRVYAGKRPACVVVFVTAFFRNKSVNKR